MAVPTLTTEQRKENLAKAMAVRSERAKLKAAVASGDILFEDVLERDAAQRIKVFSILCALRGIGDVKAKEIMRRCNIAENRRIGGLGAKQKSALIEMVKEYER